MRLLVEGRGYEADAGRRRRPADRALVERLNIGTLGGFVIRAGAAPVTARR